MANTCAQIVGGFKTFFCHQGIKFIVTFEFMHRFSFYGVQTMMFLFWKHEMSLPLHLSIAIVHLFGFVNYICPLLGSAFADIVLGRFKGILLYSLIALAGIIMIALAAASEALGYTAENKNNFVIIMSSFGFLLHAIGGGSINAVISDFGRDQFLSTEEQLKAQFYALFFHALSFGTIGAVILSPMLRMGFQCAGLPYCFPFGFIVSAGVLLVGLVILVIGQCSYYYGEVGRSVITETLACIIHACANRSTRQDEEHWLDCALDLYVPRFVDDVRHTLHALWLFIPLPIFWALFEQMWSRWISQATFMDGTLNDDYGMEPDSMPFLNPVIIMLALPVMELIVMPLCLLCRYCQTPRAPKIKILFGGLLAILAYVVAALTQVKIEPAFYNPIPRGEGEVMFWSHGFGCNITVETTLPGLESFLVPIKSCRRFRLPIDRSLDFNMKYGCKAAERPSISNPDAKLNQTVYEGVTSNFFIENRISITLDLPHNLYRAKMLVLDMPFTDYSRSELQLAKVGIVYFFNRPVPENESADQYLYSKKLNHLTVLNLWDKTTKDITLDYNHVAVNFTLWPPRNYTVYGIHNAEERKSGINFQLKRNGIYFIAYHRDMAFTVSIDSIIKVVEAREVSQNTEEYNAIKRNSVSIWWQVPQYVLISLAQLFYPVCILEYSYTQVHRRMRTVLLTMWLLTVALGNLIVAIEALCNGFSKELITYYFYVGLMCFDFLLLLLIVIDYSHWPGEEDVPEYEDEEDDDYEATVKGNNEAWKGK